MMKSTNRGFSLGSLAGALAVALSAPHAVARPEYPGQLQTAAQMTCSVGCTLCHTDPAGGTPTDFRLRGPGSVVLGDVAKGAKPPEFLASNDIDADQKFDLDELRAGTDPLSSSDQLICQPNYGCFASRFARAGRAGGMDGVGAALALVAAAVFALGRRRRPRS